MSKIEVSRIEKKIQKERNRRAKNIRKVFQARDTARKFHINKVKVKDVVRYLELTHHDSLSLCTKSMMVRVILDKFTKPRPPTPPSRKGYN